MQIDAQQDRQVGPNIAPGACFSTAVPANRSTSSTELLKYIYSTLTKINNINKNGVLFFSEHTIRNRYMIEVKGAAYNINTFVK